MKLGGSLAAVLLPVALLSGCAGTRGQQSTPVGAKPPPGPVTAVVFCADGAGGLEGTTDALRDNLGEGSSTRVELVNWSHGRYRMLSDHLHHRNIVEQGQRLARQVDALRANRPDLPVYLVGHSAGCAVALVAAERVRPGNVERVVLLAPSVSSGYDLRPALANCRLGIDAFFSTSDLWVLGFGMRAFGTTDRRWDTTAGRVGFREVGKEPRDKALYARLHQHPWDPSQAKTGHKGGHYGSFEDGFLRAYVLPLLTPTRTAPRS